MLYVLNKIVKLNSGKKYDEQNLIATINWFSRYYCGNNYSIS